jgi:hypothetical protein
MACFEAYYFHQLSQELCLRELEHQPFPYRNVPDLVQQPQVLLN